MSYELKGRIIKLFDTKQVSEKFSKREFVVLVPDGKDGKFDQSIVIQATGKHIASLDTVSVGDEVNVSFNLRGRAWQDKFFNSVEMWRIDVVSKGQIAHAPDDDGVPF